MIYLKRLIVAGIEWLCVFLDGIPTYDTGHWYRRGYWGCRFNVAKLSSNLDEKWHTGHWKEPDHG